MAKNFEGRAEINVRPQREESEPPGSQSPKSHVHSTRQKQTSSLRAPALSACQTNNFSEMRLAFSPVRSYQRMCPHRHRYWAVCCTSIHHLKGGTPTSTAIGAGLAFGDPGGKCTVSAVAVEQYNGSEKEELIRRRSWSGSRSCTSRLLLMW